MFVGKVDGQILFANIRPEEYGITYGTIDAQENTAAQFNFTLPPTNVSKDLMIPAASIISVEQDGFEIFRGTLTQYTIDNYGNYVCVANDMLASLNNILKEPFTASKSVSEYVTAILGNYNDAVEDDKKIELGNVTVTGSVSLNHHSDYASIFDLFKELVSEKGGLISLRYENGNVYLDYLAENSNTSKQTIAFGKNLVDINSQIDTSTLLSRVYPLGKGGLNISSVNSGKTYLVNNEVEATYGRIEKPFVAADIESASALKSLAQAYLTRYAALQDTIELTAIDLSILDKTLNSFAVGDSVRVISPPHGIDANMPVTQITIDVLQPGNSRITLGTKQKELTSIIGG